MLEQEYFSWVNTRLDEEFGVSLDVEQMIERDLAELDTYFPPRGAVLVAEDGADLAGMVFLAPVGRGVAQVRRMTR